MRTSIRPRNVAATILEIGDDILEILAPGLRGWYFWGDIGDNARIDDMQEIVTPTELWVGNLSAVVLSHSVC